MDWGKRKRVIVSGGYVCDQSGPECGPCYWRAGRPKWKWESALIPVCNLKGVTVHPINRSKAA